MAAKKFSLKDNPIFESTAIPVKKDREKHPLNAIYSPSEKAKRKVGNEPFALRDKIKEWSAKKINSKILTFSAIALIAISSLFIYSWWKEVSRIEHPAPLIAKPAPILPEPKELFSEKALPEALPLPEEALLEEAPLLKEELEEEKEMPPPPRRLRDEKWLLSAIIFDGANSRALLNRRIVRPGDTIGKVKVVEITPDSVVLVRGEETFTLRLETEN